MKPLNRSTVIETAVTIARGEIGKREVGTSNSGADVRKYQRATTLGGTGWPWCAAFDAYVLQETGKRLGIEIPWSNSASCDVLLADGRARGLLHTTPQVGDVVLVMAKRGDGYSKTDAIHTGINSAVRAKTFRSIEGNTNGGGGREGIAVMEHERPISARYLFLRWIDGVTLAPEVAPAPYAASLQTAAGVSPITTAMFGGATYVRIGDVAAVLGKSLAWDAANSAVIFHGREIGLQPRFVAGRAFFAVRALCELMGWKLDVDVAAREVVILP